MKKLLLLCMIFVNGVFAQFPALGVEGFETNLVGPSSITNPSSWILDSGTTGNQWAVFDNGVGTIKSWTYSTTTGFPHSGTQAAFCDRENIGQGNTSEDYLATPLITVPANCQLHFWTRTAIAGDDGSLFFVKVAPATATQTNPASYTTLQQWTETSLTTTYNVYEEKVVDLSLYAGQQVYIAFVQQYTQPTATISGDSWIIDDVNIMSQCITPSNLVATIVNSNTSILSWTSNSSSWHVLALPCGSAAPTATTTGWVLAASNPFTLTGLMPNTCYTVYVRSACSSIDFSDWSNSYVFTTPLLPPVCGGTFTDTGGLNNNYSNGENITWSICPSNPGDLVSLSFTSFDLENNVDFLYVYDGVGSAGSGLGTYTGNALPPTITSTDPSGCLTVVFTSDALNSASGWIANVTCAPPADCFNNPVGVTAVAQTDTTLILSWQNALGNPIVNSEVIVQPQGYPAPNSVSQGVLANVTPHYITGLMPNTCYDIYVRNVCSTGITSNWVATNVCTSDCQNTSNCPYSAVLIAFFDANENGIKDANENNFTLGNFQVLDSNNSNLSYYSSNGTAFISLVDPSITYNFSYSIFSTYQNYYSCSTNYSNLSIPMGTGTQYYYFPVTEIQPYSDIVIGMNAFIPRPGFSRNFNVNYYNQSVFNTVNGTITFTKSTPESIISISDSNAVLTPTGFTLDYNNLLPFQSNYFMVQMQTPPIPAVNLGDLLTTSATITSDVAENNTANNTYTINQTVVGSYDPNEIQERHGKEIVWNTFTPNDYLYYTISFENTGTAAASFIRIEDLLDAQLNPETIELVASSHDCQLNRTGNNLVWHFYNINLPPTATNLNTSHGYVTFRIKPNAGYAINDIIPNTAQIYFDYNLAIVTNTWETKFVAALNVQNQNIDSVKLYPNPASSSIRLIAKENIDSITIYDAIGKQIFSKNNYISEESIDIHTLENGFYLVEIISQNKKSTLKFLKR